MKPKQRMDVTAAMLSAAFEEALAAGLFHRRSSLSNERADKEVLLSILNAAFAVMSSSQSQSTKVSVESS
jgi:hypothetical protein